MRRARAASSDSITTLGIIKLFLYYVYEVKVSNHHGLAKLADLQGDTLCLRPVTVQYGVVRLMDFAILQSGLNLSDVVQRCIASHRVTPLFSSDGISTEWVLFPLQRRPLQQREGRGLLLVAAHVAL